MPSLQLSPKARARWKLIAIFIAVFLALAVLAAVIASKRLRGWAEPLGGDNAAKSLAQIKSLETGMYVFHLFNHRYPTEKEGLELVAKPPTKGKLSPRWNIPVEERLKDGWGRRLTYRQPGKIHPDSYDIVSPGEDGELDTEDDITN